MQELFDRTGDSHEKKHVSDAIINLYAAHVLFLLYPYNHPLVSDSLKNAFQCLHKALRKKPRLSLETVEGRLMVDGELPDGDVPVLGNFASWLGSMNIKSLAFMKELTRRELISFHKIVSTKNLTVEEMSRAMSEKNIVNISVHPVKFSAGHAGVSSRHDEARQELIKDFEDTMYHTESGQAQSSFFMRPDGASPHEDAANYGLISGNESRMDQPENPMGLSSFGTDYDRKDDVQEILPHILSQAEQETCKPSRPEGEADMPTKRPAFVPSRTIEGSDFFFDFVACGKAVLHDIEISGETAGLFNESHIQDEMILDALSSSVRATAVDEGSNASIIAECTEEAITEASFDVVLELLESDFLDEETYRKLEGRFTAFVGLFSEKGEFEKVLELFNSLKTQSLQGKWSVHATVMIRRIFSSERVNAKVVDAMRRYGRKRRDAVSKLASALRSFIIPYLLDALTDESDTSTRRFIMSLLISLRSEAVEHIAKRLRDSSWYVVRNMLYLLRECRGRSYAQAVRGFLEHEVPLVRLEALRTLLSFQDPDADACVIKFLRSDVFQLQKGAVRLTGSYRIKCAVPYLLQMLREKDTPGKRYLFKKGIVRALGRIGDGRSAGHLLNICESISGLHKDEADKLKVEIFRTLHNYPASTIGPLVDYGRHSDNVEIMAISRKLIKQYGLTAGKQG